MDLFSNRILEKTPKPTDPGENPSIEQSFWVMLTFFGLPHFIFTSILPLEHFISFIGEKIDVQAYFLHHL